MTTDTVSTGFEEFMATVRGIDTQHIVKALNTFTPGTDWSNCSRYRMAECYGQAMADRSPGVLDLTAAALRSMDIAALSMRARACAEGRAGWAEIGRDAGEATAPALTMAEVAAEVFREPVLASLRQEVRDVSRSLLHAEDKLRTAEQRAKNLQEHNAALLAPVEQAAAPGGISEHEFARPGGWRERALRVAAQARAVA
jgi:hypothetical protein